MPSESLRGPGRLSIWHPARKWQGSGNGWKSPALHGDAAILAPQGSRVCTSFGPFTTGAESPQKLTPSRCYANLLRVGVGSYDPG
jgi:hypothetical protein